MAERLKKFLAIIRKRRTPIGIVILLAAVVGLGAFLWGNKASASDYITAKVERGNVEVNVSATGTVQAVVTVQVGSQVSGTVSWLGADFNSQVSKGQIVARLDPAIFQAQVDNARANVANAEAAVAAAETEINNQKANLQAAKANQEVSRVQREDAAALVKRYQELQNVLSGRDLEAAQAQANAAAARYEQAVAQVAQTQAANGSVKAKLDQARASVSQAKAQLQQSQLNLDHSIIASPIDGVVVSRNVDVGQTVAASLQAPTLFTIANDLTKMQVLASIDEADVGQIRAGIRANFAVDAFSGETFSGNISQLRLNAQTQQNVVTYSAVIDVSNPDLKLRPGMTANITIPVARRDNVLTVPNAALRFKPTLSDREQEALRQKMDERRKEMEAARQARQESGEGQQPAAAPDQQGQPNANSNQTPRSGGQAAEQRNGEGRKRSDGGQAGGGEGAQGNREAWRQPNAGQGNSADPQRPGGEGGTSNREAWRKSHAGQGNSADSQRPGSEGGNFNREAWRQRRAAQGNADGQRPAGEVGHGDGQSNSNSAAGGQGSQPQQAQGGAGVGSQRQGGQFTGGGGGSRRQSQMIVIWVLAANKAIEPRFVRAGLSNGRVTEIIGDDIHEGDTVIIGQNDNGNARPQQPAASPFNQQQRPPGMPGGRGPGR